MRRRRLQGWACGQGAGWHAWQGNGRIAKAQPVVAGGGGAVPVLNTARGPRRMLPAPPRHAGSLAAPPARLASLKRPAQGAGRSPARCPPCGRVPATPGRRPPWRASLGHRRRAPVLCGVVRRNRVRSLVYTGAALPRTARRAALSRRPPPSRRTRGFLGGTAGAGKRAGGARAAGSRRRASQRTRRGFRCTGRARARVRSRVCALCRGAGSRPGRCSAGSARRRAAAPPARAGAGREQTEQCFAVMGIQGSSVVLTCLCWSPSQPGVMHRLSADLVKGSESWNHSDMYRDCVH